MMLTDDLAARLFTQAGRAPSAHNTQPWLPEVDGAEVVVRVDPARTLPAGDPHHQDLHLAMGAWVEAFSIAAAEAGLEVRPSAVSGSGPDLEIRLSTSSASDPAPVSAAEAARDLVADAPLRVADLEHRQVNRGPMRRDVAAFASAMGSIETELDGTPLRLVVVDDPLWRSLLSRASLSSMSVPAIFVEMLEWFRFDANDPRYVQDGLTDECLQLPSWQASAAARVNTDRLRPIIGALTPYALLPARAVDELARRLRGRRDPSAMGRRSAGTSAPHHVALLLDPRPAAPSSCDFGLITDPSSSHVDTLRLLEAGRRLLRIWLLLDRCGLGVDVHSEIKDRPVTKNALIAALTSNETEKYITSGHARELRCRSPEAAGTRDGLPAAIATFSTGAAMGPVPRSHRLG